MTHGWPQPDFIAAAPRRPAIAWAWVAVAAAVLALPVREWLDARRDLAAQDERLARATQRLARVDDARMPRASARSSRPMAAAPSNADALRSARQVVDRIVHPWDRILANLEAEAPDGTQWLAFDHDADDDAVRLEGAAAGVPPVLQLVDNLSDRPGWSDVALTRLQAADAREAGAGPAWRFELHATVDAKRVTAARPPTEN